LPNAEAARYELAIPTEEVDDSARDEHPTDDEKRVIEEQATRT
jgi:hypothetical protein